MMTLADTEYSVMESLSVVFSLVTFALLADYSKKIGDLTKLASATLTAAAKARLSAAFSTPIHLVYAATGIAAFLWVLFVLSLVFLCKSRPFFTSNGRR
jgi:hypothetical protein